MSKVMISVPQEILQEFDEAARKNHKRRSELLKDLMLEYLHGDVQHRKPTAKEVQEQIRGLREYTFKMEPGETAEGIIRKMRDSR